MRNMLLASAAVLGMALAMPALAQNNTTTGATPPAGTTMRPMQHGANMGPSNITPADTRNVVAPKLPQPDLPANASPSDFLRAAQQDVQHRRGGAAQAALGDAEIRLLNRAVAPSEASQPDRSPAVQHIEQARQALASRDWQGADQHITSALQSVQMAESGTGHMMTQPGAASGGTVGSPGMSHMPPANGTMQPGGTMQPNAMQPSGGGMAPSYNQ